MENLTLVIGNKLKNIRNSRNLSLDDVAELTGVSKAMLGQIDLGCHFHLLLMKAKKNLKL